MSSPRPTSALVLLVLACGPGSGDGGDADADADADAGDTETSLPTSSTPTGTDSDDPNPTGEDTGQMSDGQGPQSTPWETVVMDLPFPLAEIHTLTIGRKEYNGNFANRGDIEVLFDQDLEVITIELRKYDFSDVPTAFGDPEQDIVGTFARMSPWAYNTGTANPTPPSQQDPASNCLGGAWKDNCALYLYYDGQSQPVRSGADLRVHLPRAYRGELNLQTEDNENEASYPRRGDITVSGTDTAGWCGSGTVKLSAGVARVRMCRDLTPAPTCPPDQIAACENFQDDLGEDAAWSPDCPCPAMLFGQTRIESLKPWAANITVDVPGTVWMNATVANEGAQPHACKPQLTNCSGDCQLVTDEEFTKTAEFNYPSPAAISGAGYNLLVLSAGCALVKFLADEYAPWDPASEPAAEERGHVTLCTDCL